MYHNQLEEAVDGGESREENTLRMWLNSLGLRDAKVNQNRVGVFRVFVDASVSPCVCVYIHKLQGYPSS